MNFRRKALSGIKFHIQIQSVYTATLILLGAPFILSYSGLSQYRDILNDPFNISYVFEALKRNSQLLHAYLNFS